LFNGEFFLRALYLSEPDPDHLLPQASDTNIFKAVVGDKHDWICRRNKFPSWCNFATSGIRKPISAWWTGQNE